MKQDIICSEFLTEEALSCAVAEFFQCIRPDRQRLFNYYRSEQPIPKGEAVRGRPNNLLRSPYPRYITEVHTGYFLGVPPTFSFSESQSGEIFHRLSDTIQLEHLLYDVGQDASICGTGFVLVWLDRSGLKACRCDPLSCFSIRSSSAGAPLLGSVRLFQEQQNITRGILYHPDYLQTFIWDGTTAHLGSREENLLHTLPLIPFANNCEGCGDFEMVTGLVDAYNLLLSGAMDDMQSVANAFLALYGMQGTTKGDIDRANHTRILSLAEGGKAEFVVKNLNHEALGQLEVNLRRSILQLSMTPDLSDEAFSGNSSGVALQYKLWGIEQVRAAKERSFLISIHSLLTALAKGLDVLGINADFSAVKPTFYKNLPQDHAALAQTLLTLSPVLSCKTILEQLPWVQDAEEELRRKAEETTQNTKGENE